MRQGGRFYGDWAALAQFIQVLILGLLITLDNFRQRRAHMLGPFHILFQLFMEIPELLVNNHRIPRFKAQSSRLLHNVCGALLQCLGKALNGFRLLLRRRNADGIPAIGTAWSDDNGVYLDVPAVVLNLDVLHVLVDTSQGEKLIHINKDNFYREYYAALERIGARRLPPYSCRHTTGTDLAKAAVPAFTIQKIMRHAKITTTQIYTHMDATDALTGVNALKKPENKGA